MTDQPEKRAKQHDLEETPRDKARRLVRADTQRVADRSAKLRARLYHHGRFLSDEDKRELLGFLETQFEQARTVLDGVGDAPEFGFTSEVLDRVEL
jgi:hypothetical protein